MHDTNRTRAKRKQGGLCPYCGEMSERPGKRCKACLKFDAKEWEKQRDKLLAMNLCPYCGRRDCPSLDPWSFGMFRQACFYQELRRLIRERPGSRGAELFGPLLDKYGWPGILNGDHRRTSSPLLPSA